MADPFDPRLTPARADLAARHLEGQVQAARFVDGIEHEVVAAVAPVRNGSSASATQLTQALRGERVTVYDTQDGWGWGQLAHDGFVGWLPLSALAKPGPASTHKVAVLSTLAFPGASIKLPPVATLPLGARLNVVRSDGHFAITTEGWHLPVRHLVARDHRESDAVAVAERFLGTPYLWGGKTSVGLDCSGLVQVALGACGIACLRDSDMQEKGLGSVLPSDAVPRRGDLLFWKGHVALARDAVTMIHANAHHMSVAIEPIDEGIARIAAAGSAITSVRRLIA